MIEGKYPNIFHRNLHTRSRLPFHDQIFAHRASALLAGGRKQSPFQDQLQGFGCSTNARMTRSYFLKYMVRDIKQVQAQVYAQLKGRPDQRLPKKGSSKNVSFEANLEINGT